MGCGRREVKTWRGGNDRPDTYGELIYRLVHPRYEQLECGEVPNGDI